MTPGSRRCAGHAAAGGAASGRRRRAGADPRHAQAAQGYFLSAESFFSIASFVDGGGTFAPDLSLYGEVPLHEQSHGQSFLALAANRFAGQSLYILDEPEAALSVSGALALLAIMVRAAGAGAQFVVATHAPILLACPDARIYELDDRGVSPCEYDDVEAVRLTRGFLDAPERFIRAALGAEGVIDAVEPVRSPTQSATRGAP